MAGGFADDSAARAAILLGAASGIPAGGAYGVNPSPFGVAGVGAPRTSGADASVAAALAAKGGGGGDDEAVAAAAAAFFAAMNANTQNAAARNANAQNAAARNANAQNAVENAGTRGRDSGVSEDTDVGKEGDARRHKEGSVRSPRRDDAAEDDAPKEQAPPVEAPPVEALPSNAAAGHGRWVETERGVEPIARGVFGFRARRESRRDVRTRSVDASRARRCVRIGARDPGVRRRNRLARGGGATNSFSERRTSNVERRTSNDAFLRGKYNTGIRPSRFVARATSNARPILVRSKTSASLERG